MTKWISQINSPEDLKKVPLEKLSEAAQEYRDYLIQCVSQTGGHLGASLGALELNLALHYVLDSPKDKICWDVGHQAYVHKMITGRRDRMLTLRQPNGLSGFPSPFESPHDPFIVGHAGTAISQALGLACARDLKKESGRVVAVIGDATLTSGLSYEALNNAGHLKKDMLIVLNDNKMAIAKNVGAIARYLNKIITNPIYNRIRAEVEKQLVHFPRLRRMATAGLETIKHLLVPGILFEELGFRYFGPIDGHDVVALVNMLRKVVPLHEACFLHVITQKGKGYKFAERDAECLHGVTPFNVETGEKIKGPAEAQTSELEGPSYTQAFGNALRKIAREESRVVAITAAMPSGTGLLDFQNEFPDRFFDVGIAEQHAVTFGGALAKGGMKPVCAVYSTFLQRSYDSLIHDVALQRLPLTVCCDRAGLVGGDGATHNGVFDISYLSSIPHSVVAAPVNEAEMERMLRLSLDYPHLFALRFPRDYVPAICRRIPSGPFQIGEAQVLREGREAVILAIGSMVGPSLEAYDLLKRDGLEVRVVNMRFVKPLDARVILDCVHRGLMIFTVEEHVLSGGFGARVMEFLEREDLSDTRVRRIALPDEFIEHGSRSAMFERFGLSPERIASAVYDGLHAKATLPIAPQI